MDNEGSSTTINNNSYPVLVTGAGGLVGTSLVSALLHSGEKVKAIYHHTPLTGFDGNKNLSTVHCDILDTFLLEELLNGVERVYHCAALVSFDPKDHDALFRVNTEGTASVVNACISSGVKKLLHVSTVSALGRLRENEEVNESMQWSEKTSNSVYGKSKYLAEMEVWRGIGEGLNAVIVNPSLILGGSTWDKGSGAIFKSVYDEFPWYTDGVSGFVGVHDVVKAMILLMNSDIVNERFILNAVNSSYRDVFDLIAIEFNKEKAYRKVSPLLSEIIWRVEAVKGFFSKKKPLLTKETAATALAKVYYNNSKLKQFLPEFTYEPVQKTIADACRSLRLKYNL